MKISQMTNDQACDAIIRLTPAVANIADEPKLDPILKELGEKKEGVSVLHLVSNMLPKIVPLLLKDHKADLYEIISVLSDKTKAEVGKMRIVDTISVLRDSIDEDLIGFFKSSSPVTEKTGEE